jgi:hypothetical protein
MAGKYLFIIFLFLFTQSFKCTAEDSISSGMHEYFAPDSLRIPAQSDISVLLKDKEYHYGSEYKAPPNKGFLAKLTEWIFRWFSLGLKTVSYWPLVFKILIIGIFIVFLFVIATRTKLYKVFYTDKEPVKIGFREIDPINRDFDFDKAISVEMSTGNFRNAIRLLHLKALNYLHSRQIIKLAKDKTNRDYSYEINDPALRNRFADLSLIYNLVWYGKHDLKKDEFDSLLPGFLNFTNIINGGQE